MDDFATNFGSCTNFPGDLIIAGDDITDLSGLQNIESINGTLAIQNNDALTNVDGLQGLNTIGGGYFETCRKVS